MKKFRKLLALVLAVAMVCAVSVTAWAEEESPPATTDTATNTGLKDGPGTTKAEQMAMLDRDNASAEQRAFVTAKLSNEIPSSFVKSRAATWTYLPNFPIYKQAYSYYCVPASVKAVVQYKNKSSDSQDDIAGALGTTSEGTKFSSILPYLNETIEYRYAEKDADTTLDRMQYEFDNAIPSYDAPPIISAKFTTADGWYANISAHTMLISGKQDDLSAFRVSDPYIQWVKPSASMNYNKSATAIHTAISDRGNGYLY